jgi:hypothetical protein
MIAGVPKHQIQNWRDQQIARFNFSRSPTISSASVPVWNAFVCSVATLKKSEEIFGSNHGVKTHRV